MRAVQPGQEQHLHALRAQTSEQKEWMDGEMSKKPKPQIDPKE